MSVQANFVNIYLRGMRDRSMRSGTELTQVQYLYSSWALFVQLDNDIEC